MTAEKFDVGNFISLEMAQMLHRHGIDVITANSTISAGNGTNSTRDTSRRAGRRKSSGTQAIYTDANAK